MTQRIFGGLLVSVLTAASLAAQQQPVPPAQPAPQPPVTFRVEVNYIEVDAIVTDAQGRIVTDLKADDFEVLEDRRPQMVSAFSLVNIPIERTVRPLFAANAVEPDVQTNTGADGRLYLIVLDTWHISPVNALKVRTAMRQFIERNFAANDMAAVVFTNGQTKDSQDFTNNRRLLLAAIDKVIGMKIPGATVTVQQDINARLNRQPGDPVRDALGFERAMNARNAMDRIRTLAEFMRNLHGRRKAMLLVSEGVEYDFSDILADTNAGGVLETVRDAVGASMRANVAIYGIDPRGLANPDSELIQFANNVGADDPSLAGLGSRSIAQEFRTAQRSLSMLSDETGGFAVINQNNLTNAFERIVQDNSTYYVLGYYSTNERRDGRFRSITVRVKRPGLTVRARRGYVAPRGRAPNAPAATAADPTVTAMNDAIASPLPVPGIPLRVAAMPFRGEAPNANVALAIEMGMQAFQLTEAGGTFNGKLEVGFVATDSEAKERGSATHTLTLALKPETVQRGQGLRVLSQVELPPGRYQIRVGAAEAGGKNGSVIADVEVPDFTRAPMTMSAVALTSASAAEMSTVRPRDPLAQFLPGPPSAVREFSRNDELALFVEFYENLRNVPSHKVDISTSVRSDTGRVVFNDDQERESTELQGGAGGYGYSVVFSLRDFEPGLYVIHVEGRSRATAAEAGVGRDIQILVK